MNIPKAIEILSEEVKHPYGAKRMARPDALKLGIEALKRIIELHEDDDLLPGETKEGETE